MDNRQLAIVLICFLLMILAILSVGRIDSEPSVEAASLTAQ